MKSLELMTYEEMLNEKFRVMDAMKNTKSIYLKNDYSKYLHKINKELKDYRKFQAEARKVNN
jgi:hypothetical protein